MNAVHNLLGEAGSSVKRGDSLILGHDGRLRPAELYQLFDRAYSWVRINGRDSLNFSDMSISFNHNDLTMQGLYGEMSFAILASGFRVKTIQKKWPELSALFMGWDPNKIYKARICDFNSRNDALGKHLISIDSLIDIDVLKKKTLAIFNNPRKIDSLLHNAGLLVTIVKERGWPKFREEIYADINNLKQFAYVGDILKYHVARNIGIDTIKPDVHIVRVSEHYGIDPFEMAEELSKHFKLSKHAVDSVLWRYGSEGMTQKFWDKH